MAKFSLWITPQKELQDKIQVIIDQFSQKGGATKFPAHMTLFGEFEMDENEAFTKTQKLAEELVAFNLTLGRVDISTTYYQNIFVRVNTTAELMDAHVKARQIFEGKPNYVFMPHISLVYGDFDMKERDNLAKEIGQSLEGAKFRATRIDLIPSESIPELWKPIKSFELKNSK